MNKRGQVFIIAAIILAIALFSVSVTYNSISVAPPLTEYRKLSENYLSEYPKVANFARYNNDRINEADFIDSFTDTFLSFARTKEPNFGIFYTYKDSNGNVNIVNTLNKKALIVVVDNPAAAEDLVFEILSANFQSRGNVCVDGVGCSGANSDVNNYGGDYSNQRSVRDIGRGSSLKIRTSGSSSFIEIPLDELTSGAAITESSDDSFEGQEIAGVREVRIVQYP